jgi:hypothetical protein
MYSFHLLIYLSYALFANLVTFSILTPFIMLLHNLLSRPPFIINQFHPQDLPHRLSPLLDFYPIHNNVLVPADTRATHKIN